MLALYGFIPPYIVYADSIGLLPHSSRIFAMGGMALIGISVFAARKRGHTLFSRNRKTRAIEPGFTLMELMIVISIIGILAALIFPVFTSARNAAYVARSKTEFKSIATALELYTNATGSQYPADVDRGLPPGLESYLGPGEWPEAPWPGSVYDWDSWNAEDLAYSPQEPVRQISIRFCPLNQPALCKFPHEPWAVDFDYYSSVYYCISGSCRSHSSKPANHPGYCVNC